MLSASDFATSVQFLPSVLTLMLYSVTIPFVSLLLGR